MDIEKFSMYLKEEEKSGNTVEKYTRDVRTWSEWCGKTGTGYCKEDVISYKNHLIQSGYSKRSINSMLCSVNAYLDYAGLGSCKVKLLKLQRDVFCDERKELTKEEFKRLSIAAMSCGDNRLFMLLQTLCATGIRVSELPFVTVEAVREGETAVTLKGKTRTVFFVRKLRKKLLDYARESGIKTGQIFVTRTGRPMSRTNIWREMKKLCKKADVDESKVFPHNLRHLFARVFYELKKDIAKLADILGHSSIETTRIYIASSGYEHRRLMEKMRLII